MKKSELKERLVNKIALALGAGMFSIMPFTAAMPAGGSSDTAVIASNGNTMSITGSANNVINWQSFSIAKNETVNFDANNYLNLVTGPEISNIYGTLSGGGHIFLVNPNGILFGSGAVINVGALTASTAPLEGIDKDTFLAGNTNLSQVVLDEYSSKGDISMALVNVQSANKLVLHADEIVLQNTDVLDKVTQIKGQTEEYRVYIGSEDPENLTLTAGQAAKVGYIDGFSTVKTIDEVDMASAAKLITDAAGLKAIGDNANNMTGSYILGGDVDLSESGNFMPIGLEVNMAFGGHFNGMGYTIKNLKIDTSEISDPIIYTGLFVDVYGTIRNFTLQDATVIGKGINGIGAVTNRLEGMISNVAIIGNSSISGGDYSTGGIAGEVSGTITNVYNEANVSGVRDIGGIVGCAYGGTIINAVNKGQVTAEKGAAGGIVGKLIPAAGEQTIIRYVKNSGEVIAPGKIGPYASSGEDGIAGGVIGILSPKVLPYSQSNTANLEIADVFNEGRVTDSQSNGVIVGATSVPNNVVFNLNSNGNMYYLAGSGDVTSYEGTTFGTAVDAATYAAKSAGWNGGFPILSVANSTNNAQNSGTQTNNSSSGSENVQTSGEIGSNSGTTKQGGDGNAVAAVGNSEQPAASQSGSYGNVLLKLFADMPFAQQKELTLGVGNNMVVIAQKQNQDSANSAPVITSEAVSNLTLSNKGQVLENSDTVINSDDSVDKEKENNRDDKEVKE